jgi:outer membrane protein OmpA-like peptidoglycan-associated protein
MVGFGVVLAGIMVLSGCASKKYVRQQVGALQPSIQEAQNGVKENAERIDAVDKRAQQGIAAAATADQKAVGAQNTANTATQAAQTADRKADTANTGVQQANTRIGGLETRINNINTLDTYTQSETQSVTFDSGKATLSNMAKATLDKVASSVAGQAAGFMLELQGYTDNVGGENLNIGLSQRRAEAVQRYLVSKNVPLFRISIVGLGKENPVADNKTRQGRAENRRVEVRVLKAQTNAGRQTN